MQGEEVMHKETFGGGGHMVGQHARRKVMHRSPGGGMMHRGTCGGGWW